MDPSKNLLQIIEELYKKVEILENQVKELQQENIHTNNTIYEISNSLEERIDILASEPYNLNSFSLDK